MRPWVIAQDKFSRRPRTKLSKTMISGLFSRTSRSAIWEPTRPAPPVMRTRSIRITPPRHGDWESLNLLLDNSINRLAILVHGEALKNHLPCRLSHFQAQFWSFNHLDHLRR